MIHDASVKKLFSEYEKAFDALDIEKSAGFFADAFISAGPPSPSPLPGLRITTWPTMAGWKKVSCFATR
jgi:hypothetical protein